MKVILHTCPFPHLRGKGHPCWRVEAALRAAGVEYKIQRNPSWRLLRRRIVEGTGQRRVPVIEFADGSMYRDESKAMAAEILGGRLGEHGPGGHAGGDVGYHGGVAGL